MYFRFSVDDNIWFLRDLTYNQYSSIFDHPYLSIYKELHEKYNAKFQLNIYYETQGFNLSQMSDRYKAEWESNSSWLKLSFHAKADAPPYPYFESTYEEAYNDCSEVNKQIIRFAGENTISYFTTIHYCQASKEALKGFYDAGLRGLVGLFNDDTKCYNISYGNTDKPFIFDKDSKFYYFTNDMIVNLHPQSSIIPLLEKVNHKEFIEVMIHEQYYYKSFHMYQPDFKAKIEECIKYLTCSGRKSVFLEEII